MSLQQRITALAQAVGADIRKLDVSRHPAIRPSLRLDFINCARLDPRITFTRASGAGRFNAQGVYEWLPADQPRIDFDPVTGECRGLLIEEQRTNKCSAANYNPTSLAGMVIGGSGAADATLSVVNDSAELAAAGLSALCSNGQVYKLDNSAGTGFAWARPAGSASEVAHTLSAYVRSTGGLAYLDYDTTKPGAVKTIPATTKYSRVAGTAVATSLAKQLRIGADAGTVIYFILFQMEEGAQVSSVIPVAGGAQVTRAASDPLLQTLSPWFNQSAGTFIIEHDAMAGRPLLSSGENLLASSAGAGRTVLAYDATGSYVSQNGGEFVAGPPLTFGDSLRLMRSATQWANAHCRALRYYPRRLTLAEASA